MLYFKPQTKTAKQMKTGHQVRSHCCSRSNCALTSECFLLREGRQDTGTKVLSLAGKPSQTYSACKGKQQEPPASPLGSRGAAVGRGTDTCSVRQRDRQKTAVSRRGHYENYRLGDPDCRNTNNAAEEHPREGSVVWLETALLSGQSKEIGSLSPFISRAAH